MTHAIPYVEYTIACIWSVINVLNVLQGSLLLEKDLCKPIDVITHIYQITGLAPKSVDLFESTVKVCGFHLQASKNTTK